MFLKEIQKFQPHKYGFFLKHDPLIVATHPSSRYLAFVTRQSQVIVHDRINGKTSTYLKSKNSIVSVLFTQKYLLIVEKGVHELLVYSLKSQKIKKKITGHRQQITKLSYCFQRKIFGSISNDVCILWDELTLTQLKRLKCSTSQYYDINFSQNGSCLFTSFRDGNVFNWNLQTFEHKYFPLDIKGHHLKSFGNKCAIAYNEDQVYGSLFYKEVFRFQMIQKCWDGRIKNIDFLNNYLVIKTSEQFYICELKYGSRIQISSIHLLTDPVSNFIVEGYASQLTIINKDHNHIRHMELYQESQNNKIPLTNPLLNQQEACSGGYQNACYLTNQLQNRETYNYEKQDYKVQNMNAGLYQSSGLALDNNKLKGFIKKNHIYPDKYRPSAYKYLLHLPISRAQFKKLQRLKCHNCTQILKAKYKLQNEKLFSSMENIISLLANYNPIFAESQTVPSIVFPFVCLFGNDEFFCFEVLHRLFNHWLSFLFEEFPLANSKVLQNIQAIMELQDLSIIKHLASIKASFTKLVWGLLSSLFTTTMNRQNFLSVVDSLFSHSDSPYLIFFIVMGFIYTNKSVILSMRDEKDLQSFLQNEQTTSIGKVMKKAYSLMQKYKKQIRYKFVGIDRNAREYRCYLKYPEYAVKMYKGKRQLQTQQYNKELNQIKYQQQLRKEMENIHENLYRQRKRQQIQAQSVALLYETQLKNKIKSPELYEQERIRKLNKLIVELETMLQADNMKKNKVREYMPKLNQFSEGNNERIAMLQNRLMGLMTKVKGHRFDEALNTQPIALSKKDIGTHQVFKGAQNAKLTNQFWKLDQLQHQKQKKHFNKDFLSAI